MEKLSFKEIEIKKSRRLTPRQEMIEKIVYELGIEDKRKRGIYFLANEKVTDNELYEMWQKARSWKVNPPALFYKLLKARSAEIKRQLKGV